MAVQMIQAVSSSGDAVFDKVVSGIRSGVQGHNLGERVNKGSVTWNGPRGTADAGEAILTATCMAQWRIRIGVKKKKVAGHPDLGPLPWGGEFRTTGFQKEAEAFVTIAEVTDGSNSANSISPSEEALAAFIRKLLGILYGNPPGPDLFAQMEAL